MSPDSPEQLNRTDRALNEERTKEQRRENFASSAPAPAPEAQVTPQVEERRERAQKLQAVDQEIGVLQDGQLIDISDSLLRHAHIPNEEQFTYTPALQECIAHRARELQRSLVRLNGTHDAGAVRRIEEQIQQQIHIYAEDILQQFSRDNLSAENFQAFYRGRLARTRELMDLRPVAAQLEIVKGLAAGDRNAARESARTFVRSYILNLPTGTQLDTRTEAIIDHLADAHVALSERVIFPVVQRKIQEFAERGFWNSLWQRAKQTASFFGDWIATPFSNGSRDRMASALTPLFFLNYRGGYDQILPILRDIAVTSFHVSVSNSQLIELLQSIAGALAFDALTIAATFGAGSVLRGAQAAGTGARAVEGAAGLRGAGVALTALRTTRATTSTGRFLAGTSYAVAGVLTTRALLSRIRERG